LEASSRSESAGPLIVIAELGKADFDWLDGLRRLHYPPERNRVPAHLTLFRSLPPSAEPEVRRSLSRAASSPAPKAEISGAMDLDSGVALRVSSPELEHIRDELADAFHGLLSSQDRGPWAPHVTIQNKVEPRVARKLLEQIRAQFEPRPLKIAGLRLVRYVEGKWQPLAGYRFR
jgi:2'-5' RNA ligase